MPEKNYHHGDLKSQLIREGLKLLDKEGYDGFTLRKVAKACDVSQTAPYRHYKNKDELIAAITMQAMESFNERLEQAIDMHPGNPSNQLREMGVAYINFFSENPEYLRLLFLSDIRKKLTVAAGGENICKEDIHTKIGHPFAALYNAVVRYKEANPNMEMGQEELVLYCWGLVHGISALIAAGELPLNDATLTLVEKVLWSKSFLQ